MRIRLAEPSDRPAVEAIVAEAYAKYVARIGGEPAPMRDDYGALIAQAVVHVLEGDGGIDGLVVLKPEADSLLLDNVAVRPSAQGRGHGRALLDFAEQQARTGGFPVTRLFTHELMTENQEIYRRRGYRETHRATVQGRCRVFMQKALVDPHATTPTAGTP